MRVSFSFLGLCFTLMATFSGMVTISGCQAQNDSPPTSQDNTDNLKASSWCGVLSPDAYRVLREQGTEPRFSGEFWLHNEDGVYVCMGCGARLFDSGAKFKSSSGWPSFYEPSITDGVEKKWYATSVMVTSATYLRTALLPPDCATASTVWHLILYRETASLSSFLSQTRLTKWILSHWP